MKQVSKALASTIAELFLSFENVAYFARTVPRRFLVIYYLMVVIAARKETTSHIAWVPLRLLS